MTASKDGVKIVTIGGGSSYTPELVEGFIKRADELKIRELWLVDIEEGKEKLDIVGNLARRMVEEAGLDTKVYLTLDRREALRDADFVSTQFRVGLLPARARDERIPLEKGMLGQETNGVGGFAKALRTIPVILDICRDMEELCPDAWLVNFTNPSGMVAEAVLKHTNIKTIGLCNVPITMQYSAAEILDVDMGKILFKVAGLNHFIWARNAYLDGVDKIAEVIDTFYNSDNPNRPKNIPDTKIPMELLKDLGMLPCFYHSYYYATDQQLEKQMKDFKEGRTRAVDVIKVEEELFELYKDPNLKDKPKQLEKRGGTHYSDAACELISSIVNDKKTYMHVNIRNNGTLAELPFDSAIECTCIIGKEGAHPLNVEPFPAGARGLLQLMKDFEILTIKCAVEGDVNAGIHALTINPLVTSGQVVKELFDEVIKQNIDYLPQFKMYYEENLKQ
jgi:6-phospho-beta-glucosidase